MIFATKYEPPKNTYNSLYAFALSEFDIVYNKGQIIINDVICPITYGSDFSKEEALRDFVKSNWAKDFYRSRHYNLYKINML